MATCCLTDAGVKCTDPAGQGMFTKKVKKALAGVKGVDLVDSILEHQYMCKKHSAQINDLVGSTPAATPFAQPGSAPAFIPAGLPMAPIFPIGAAIGTAAASAAGTLDGNPALAVAPRFAPVAAALAVPTPASQQPAPVAVAAALPLYSLSPVYPPVDTGFAGGSDMTRAEKRRIAAAAKRAQQPEQETNFAVLHMNTLKRYKKHYKLAEETSTKQELIDVVSNHFRQQDVNESETLLLFAHTIRHNMSKFDKQEP